MSLEGKLIVGTPAVSEKAAVDLNLENCQKEFHTELLGAVDISLEDFLAQFKRKFELSDVVEFQAALRKFQEERKREGSSATFSYTDFYDFLIGNNEVSNSTDVVIPVDKKPYQTLQLSLFRGWRDNMLNNKEKIVEKRPKLAQVIEILEKEPVPASLNGLMEFYKKYPFLNEFTVCTYQEGIGEKNEIVSSFLHINMARFYAYQFFEKDKTEYRIYLNPKIKAVPLLSMELIRLAQTHHIPLYFKIIDYSFSKVESDWGRKDKVVVYTSKKHVQKFIQLIQQIKIDHPDWLENRSIPRLLAPVTDGVGVAEDTSEYQKQEFGDKGKSFNALRGLFLQRAWIDAISHIIIHNKKIKPRNGRTLEQIFHDNVLAAFRNNKSFSQEKIQQLIASMWESKLVENNVDNQAKFYLHNALVRTLQDILPYVPSEYLVEIINIQFKKLAGEFQINPENLAFNV